MHRNFFAVILSLPMFAFAVGGTLQGSGTEAAPWEVADYDDLKAVGFSPYTMSGHYRLVADIDASASRTEESTGSEGVEKGFKPIGLDFPEGTDENLTHGRTELEKFSGTFNGAGHVVKDLYIFNRSESSAGFFAILDSSARVDSLSFENYSFGGVYSGGIAAENHGFINEVHIVADTMAFASNAGALVNVNYGSISNSSFKGVLAGANVAGCAYENLGTISGMDVEVLNSKESKLLVMFGGIAFTNKGTIQESRSSGAVAGDANVAGIASLNYGVVEKCSSSVDIYSFAKAGSSPANMKEARAFGGVVAVDSGKIQNSHYSGNIYVSGNYAGGVVGVAMGEITECTASGTVEANAVSGGFAAVNYGKISNSSATGKVVSSAQSSGFVSENYGAITGSYAEGDVHLTASDGAGFVSVNKEKGSIDSCYATGNVYGSSAVMGGFAASNNGKISNSYAKGNVMGATSVGGFVGRVDGGSIENSYATGYVKGEIQVAGFAGAVNAGKIDKCYSTGDVIGANVNSAGFAGIVSDGRISNSFSLGNVYAEGHYFDILGSFVGANGETSFVENSFSTGYVVSDCATSDKVCALNNLNNVSGYYWNISNCTALDSADYGIGLTTEQMKKAASFDKFDFDDVWNLGDGAGFPTLKDVVYDSTHKDTAGFFGGSAERFDPKKHGYVVDNPDDGSKNDGSKNDGSKDDSDKRFVKGNLPKEVAASASLAARYEAGLLHVNFALPVSGKVELRMFDARGHEVRFTRRGTFAAGAHKLAMDASAIPAGHYISVLKLNGRVAARSRFVKK